jgi:hypothetical protein
VRWNAQKPVSGDPVYQGLSSLGEAEDHLRVARDPGNT